MEEEEEVPLDEAVDMYESSSEQAAEAGLPGDSESPAGVAALLERCLAPQDRLLLRAQAEHAAAAAAADGGASAARQGELLAPEAGDCAAAETGSTTGSSSSSSSGGGAAAAGAAAAAAAAAKPGSAGLTFKRTVEQLIHSATAAVMAQALPPQQLQSTGLFGTQQGGGGMPGSHTRGGDGDEGAAAGDGASSSGDEGSGDEGSGSEGGVFGSGSGVRSAEGAANATVTQLMALFKGSPLFRGGPVPGVQLLHQR